MPGESRIYYRKSPDGLAPDSIVVVKDGKEIASYKTTDELIETHIKGILAKDQQDTKKIRSILRAYKPSDTISGQE